MTNRKLLEAQQAVTELRGVKVAAPVALRIRRATRRITEALRDFEEERQSWVKENDLDGKAVSELTQEQRKYFNDLLDAESIWKKDEQAALAVDVLEGIEISAASLDSLIEIGVVKDGDEAAD